MLEENAEKTILDELVLMTIMLGSIMNHDPQTLGRERKTRNININYTHTVINFM